MTSTDIDASTVVEDVLAALTPQQREAWRKHWERGQRLGITMDFDAFLRWTYEQAYRLAEKRLQAHAL